MAKNQDPDITEEQAQENLLRRREQLGIQKNPQGHENIRSILSSPNSPVDLDDIFARQCSGPDTCHVHADEIIPCPICKSDYEEKARKFKDLEAIRLQELRKHPEKILQEIGIGRRHMGASLDNFAGGETIIALCRKCAEDPHDLVLSGPSGCGKTHLAVGIMRSMVQAGSLGYTGGRFITASELLMEIRGTYNGDKFVNEADLVECFGNVDFLVLDDLGAEKATEWAIATLYLIIDRRYREMKPTIVTTNLSVDDIASYLSPRIASRLAGGKVIEIKMPDWRRRRAG